MLLGNPCERDFKPSPKKVTSHRLRTIVLKALKHHYIIKWKVEVEGPAWFLNLYASYGHQSWGVLALLYTIAVLVLDPKSWLVNHPGSQQYQNYCSNSQGTWSTCAAWMIKSFQETSQVRDLKTTLWHKVKNRKFWRCYSNQIKFKPGLQDIYCFTKSKLRPT